VPSGPRECYISKGRPEYNAFFEHGDILVWTLTFQGNPLI
jgi:hypothetical protein